MRRLAFCSIAYPAIILAAHFLVASTPAEISLAGSIAGRNLYTSDTTSPQTSFDDQWARMVRITRADQSIFADSYAAAIWSEAQIDANRALAILARIAQIDNRKPSDWDVVISGFKAATEDPKDQERQEWGQDIWVRLLLEANKANLQSEFRAAERTLDMKLAELSSTIRSPYVGRGIGVTHLPSWQGAYDNDLLILKNETGRDLSLSAFFVTIQGKDGSRITHLHHASVWANGQQLYFKYPYYETDYASGQTVNHPVRVEVSVFSPDGFIQDVKIWTDDEYDNTIRKYIRDVTVSPVFLGEYVEDGTNRAYYPGAKVSFIGLNRLPVKRITVRFTRRGQTAEARWDWNKYLPAGEDVVLRAQSLAQFCKYNPPEQKQVIIEFTDSSVPAVIAW